MTRYTCMLAALFLVLAACGDDGTGSKSDNNGTENNVTTMDMGTVEDTGTDPMDMATPEDMAMPEDMGTDMAEADMGTDMAEADMGTDMGEVDMGQPYDWPATAGEFINTADRTSYVTSLGVPPIVNNTPTCCRDFGAISRNPGEIDNAFASLGEQLAGFNVGIDFQLALTEAIQNGDLVFLLDHRELDGADDPDGFLLSWLTGTFATGTTYADASVGQGVFDLDIAASFVAGTGEPQRVMDPAQMQASMMSGGPISVDVILPFGAAVIQVPVQDMNTTATASIAVDSVAYTQGELSGYLTLDDIYGGINTLAASPTCSCLGLSGDLYEKGMNGQWSGNCVANAPTLCSTSAEYACTVIAGTSLLEGGACTLLPGILRNGADLDTDGTQGYDALSIGLTWDAVDTTIQ